MGRLVRRIVITLVCLMFRSISAAQENAAVDTDIANPVISSDTRWMVVTLMIAAAIVIAAMIVGPVVRANTRQ